MSLLRNQLLLFQVKSELEKLIKLDLKKSSSDFEDKLFNYLTEERESRAVQEFNKGMLIVFVFYRIDTS